MNKLILIPIIIGSVLLVAGGTIFAIGLAGSAKNKSVTNTYELKEDFNNINVDLQVADLEFKVATDGNEKVVCEETTIYYHTVNVADNTLSIKGINNKKWYNFFDLGINKIKVTVYMNAGEYSELTVKSSTGDVNVPHDYSFNNMKVEVSTGNVKINSDVKEALNVKSSTGDFDISEMSTKSLTAKASTGYVNLNKVAVEENIEINTSTGKIHLTDTTAKNLKAKASTGNVTLTNSVMKENINITASTGNVKFEDSDADTLNIKTDTGDVKGTLLTSKIFYVKTDTGKVNVPKSTTGGICEIETDTGDVSIQIKG